MIESERDFKDVGHHHSQEMLSAMLAQSEMEKKLDYFDLKIIRS